MDSQVSVDASFTVCIGTFNLNPHSKVESIQLNNLCCALDQLFAYYLRQFIHEFCFVVCTRVVTRAHSRVSQCKRSQVEIFRKRKIFQHFNANPMENFLFVCCCSTF